MILDKDFHQMAKLHPDPKERLELLDIMAKNVRENSNNAKYVVISKEAYNWFMNQFIEEIRFE